MTSRELHKLIPEYEKVLRTASEQGWLAPLLLAHLTPAEILQAKHLLVDIPSLSDVKVTFHPGRLRGYAGFRRKTRHGIPCGPGAYRISLPAEAGIRGARLRIGLVIHEAAHIVEHRMWGTFGGHGIAFCDTLRHLLHTTNWRPYVPHVSSYRAIYDRHRGPYSLLITRAITTKKGVEHHTDRVRGPMPAEEAHEEARTLVNCASDNVIQAFVYSDTEGQFIGAFYERGQVYKPWSEEQATTPEACVDPMPEATV